MICWYLMRTLITFPSHSKYNVKIVLLCSKHFWSARPSNIIHGEALSEVSKEFSVLPACIFRSSENPGEIPED